MAMDMEKYFEGVSQGLTGKALADYVGVEVPTSSPVNAPPAEQRFTPAPKNLVYVNEPIENIVARQRGIDVPYVTQPQPEAEVAPTFQSQVDDSKDSARAAMQLIGMRGFQQDISVGIQPHIALGRWFPVMSLGSSGAASTLKALQPQGKDLMVQEIAPGRFAVHKPGGSTVQIVNTTDKQNLMMDLARRANIARTMADLDKDSFEYQSLSNRLAQVDAKIAAPAAAAPAAMTNVAPTVATAPTKKPFMYTGPKPLFEEPPRYMYPSTNSVPLSPPPAPVAAAPVAAAAPARRRFRRNPVTGKLEPIL